MSFSLSIDNDVLIAPYHNDYDGNPGQADPRWCERRVELSIGLAYLRKGQGKTLEIGNCLARNYADLRPGTDYDVVDLYELGSPGVNNVDILDWNPGYKYDTVICLSTFEHIGKDYDEEWDVFKAAKAVEHSKSLVAPSGELIFTIPYSSHPTLEEALEDGRIALTDIAYMRRTNENNDWEQVPLKADIVGYEYGAIWPYANSIIIGYYRNV